MQTDAEKQFELNKELVRTSIFILEQFGIPIDNSVHRFFKDPDNSFMVHYLGIALSNATSIKDLLDTQRAEHRKRQELFHTVSCSVIDTFSANVKRISALNGHKHMSLLSKTSLTLEGFEFIYNGIRAHGNYVTSVLDHSNLEVMLSFAIKYDRNTALSAKISAPITMLPLMREVLKNKASKSYYGYLNLDLDMKTIQRTELLPLVSELVHNMQSFNGFGFMEVSSCTPVTHDENTFEFEFNREEEEFGSLFDAVLNHSNSTGTAISDSYEELYSTSMSEDEVFNASLIGTTPFELVLNVFFRTVMYFNTSSPHSYASIAPLFCKGVLRDLQQIR